MKKVYTCPTIEVVAFHAEVHLAAASPKDQYSIGGDDSKWPEEGGIDDDYGDGPGVSGAKGNSVSDNTLWTD